MIRRRRSAVLATIEQIRLASGDISLTGAIAFLYVCENEGINIRELAQLARLTHSSASRAARRLSLPDAPHALPPAAGLLTLEPQGSDRRSRILRLTDKGRALRDDLDCVIAQAVPIKIKH